ncbi:MAG: tRNA (N6-isopentenyl adenosine(37)-C2)-methylthiotransferase MiaB [Bacteroidales bacterium]|nr:tRNA (N6-isopentenyl adenosine(37)-C2)-methylthiotransferase MiaB [Bacteroidales bacterium]
MRKVYIETYGCQMNVSDTEVVFAILAAHGYEKTEDINRADVIMANTCSVRDNAEQRILGRIEQFNLQRKARPGVVVGILGCMAERMKEALLDTRKVDIVAGPDSYRSLPQLIEAAWGGGTAINTELSRTETYHDIKPLRTSASGVSAFISIMRGCNNVCSYCVVPYTRGVERSRDAHSIVREACECFESGFREVTLLGQNVDSYLWTAADGSTVNFAQLVQMVAQVSPLLRVRFSTSNPQDISNELLEVMAANPNVCRHIHLPVQSGSNRILEKMRRRYTREWYLERVRAIRAKVPGCSITTDVIAGFCSETEEDHAQTLSLFDEVGFDTAFMFYYSERPGTLAARKYPDDVPLDIKTRRLEEIIALQNRKSLEAYKADIGKRFEVLVEGPSKKGTSQDGVRQLCGRASNNKMCVWEDTTHNSGDYVTVEIISCTQATLLGRLIE